MGCDIHLHIEIKVKGEWFHYAAPHVKRWYDLFERMAGVRGDVANAIAAPRGLPLDVTATTLFHSDYDEDGHSHSWLSGPEIATLEDWGRTHLQTNKGYGEWDLEIDMLSWTFLFGNSFAGWYKYPEDNQRLREIGLEGFRFVFWFDN